MAGVKSRMRVSWGLFAVARASRCRWFRWVAASEPSPWRCRSPGRWPLCRFRSCSTGKGKQAQFQNPEHMHTLTVPVSTLTFGGRIHFAGRAGSVWRRKMKSTSDQNLALEALRRPSVSLGLSFPETARNDLKFIPGW